MVYAKDFETTSSMYAVSRGDNEGDNGLSPANISMIVKRIGKALGLPKLSAHDLRHFCNSPP